LIGILTGIGGALCALLLALMTFRTRRGLGDRWISLWLAVYLVWFAAFGLSQIGSGPWSLGVALAAQVAVGLLAPVQFLHGWAITSGEPKAGLARAAWSLVLIAAILALPLIVAVEANSGALVADQGLGVAALLPPIAILITMAYPAMVLRRLDDHRRRLKQRLSNLHRADLAWTRFWAISTIVLLALQIAQYVVSAMAYPPVQIHVAVLLAGQVAQVAWVGWRGLTETRIFAADGAEDGAGRPGQDDQKAAREDFDHLTRFMADEEPFRDCELDAAGLADRLGWAPYRLTQALVMGGVTNFHDFVNRARIDAFKADALKRSGGRLNLLDLALAAGFGSKTAFYDAFGAVESTTPSRWLKQNARR